MRYAQAAGRRKNAMWCAMHGARQQRGGGAARGRGASPSTPPPPPRDSQAAVFIQSLLVSF